MTVTAEQFADRVFTAALGAVEIYSIHIGDRLGFYHSLADGEKTSSDLAEVTGVGERYAREWLEQQATYGILEVDLEGESSVFTLPEATSQVLTDENNGLYLAPLARMLTTAGEKMSLLLDAYRSGDGVSWEMYGQDMRESQADMNRPFFQNELADVFAGLGPVHDLLSRPGARVADIGCGAGWSTLALAVAYPEASFRGFDVDDPSIAMALQNAIDSGLDDRVTFSSDDIATGVGGDEYDLVVAFECIHDLPRPIEVLKAVRDMVKDVGVVIIMDEAVAETFTGKGDDIEKLMYGFSLLVCLPDGLSSKPSAGTGTVMRPSTLGTYAKQAGFSGFRPVAEAGFFRFYELVP